MPNQHTKNPIPVPQRFWSKVEFTESCWLWRAGKQSRGYGTFKSGAKNVYVHRWAYKFCVGPIPKGLTLDHLCHNEDESCLGGPTCLHRSCVKPEHLEPVTDRINILRGVGVTAALARQTHCIRGHALDEANTAIRPRSGGRTERVCRVCDVIRNAEYRLRKRAAEMMSAAAETAR